MEDNAKIEEMETTELEETVEETEEETVEEIQDEAEIQTTFNESSVEDLMDEEGSVENVSN